MIVNEEEWGRDSYLIVDESLMNDVEIPRKDSLYKC